METPPAFADMEMQPNPQLSDEEEMQGSEEDQEWAELPALARAKNYDVPSAVTKFSPLFGRIEQATEGEEP